MAAAGLGSLSLPLPLEAGPISHIWGHDDTRLFWQDVPPHRLPALMRIFVFDVRVVC